MPLPAGTRVGVYEVIELLGAGGMGEVYRARDSRLKRDVALKTLPRAFAGDADRVARFAREAEMLAALNHPNIAVIHGVEETAADGSPDGAAQVRALVMELIEGDTLADRLARGSIPVDEALVIARQIAFALEAAHEQGIVHRDLKPANIKLRDDGTVKVLDFGLAKLAEPAGTAGSASSGLSMSPTITSPALMTSVGVLLGTASYMSPEQAKGRAADKRSDLWAFGCVLFEMLAGKRPFEGEDVSETLAAVLRGDPDWSALPLQTPSAIATLIRRCLERDRRRRVADSAAVLFVLDEHRSLVAPPVPPDRAAFQQELDAAVEIVRQAAAGRMRRRLIAGALVAAALIAAAAGATWLAMRPSPPRVTRLTLAPIAEAFAGIATNSHDVAITSDGSRVVYFTDPAGGAARATLAVRALDRLNVTPLQVTRSLGPFLSPDDRWVGFSDQGERAIKKISILGGPAVPIAANVAALRGASWGADDTIVFGTVEQGTGLWRVPAGGGTAVELTKIQGKDKSESHAWPHILPGGRAALFTILSGAVDTAQIAVLDLRTRQWRPIIPRGTFPRYSPSGHIVYAAGSTLFAVGFDLERLAVTTNPEPMVEGVVTKESGAADFDVARDGTLVYVPGIGVDLSRRLVFVSRSGQQTPVPGLDSGNYRSVRINPQGTQIAFETAQSEGNLWTYDVARAARNPLTTGPADDRSPLWHPTEKRVVFGSTRDGRTGLFVVNSDGTGPVEPLMNDDKATELWPSSWSRDGRTLLFSANVLGLANIGEFSFADKKIDSRLSTAEFNEAFPMLSPDDLWVAYASQRAGQTQVYIERHPGLGDRRPISSGGGTQPLWSRNGRELYYFDTFNQQLMMVPITPGPNLVVGTQKALFPAALFQLRGWRTYDVMPDGRFVMILRSGSDAGTRANPIVVQNWTEELKARVPVK